MTGDGATPDPADEPGSPRPGRSRRRFLGLAGAAVLAGAAGVGVVAARPGDGDEAGGGADPGTTDEVRVEPVVLPYRGDHQAAVNAPLAPAAIVVGLDVRAGNADDLAATLTALGDAAEAVMSGEPSPTRPGGAAPIDNGLLGPEPGPNGVGVIIGYGAGLFDERFGLADRRPSELRTMPRFPNDRLVTEARSNGDLSLVVTGDTAEAAISALRRILRATRGDLVPRWMQEGFNRIDPTAGPGRAPGRNLLGFKDGTANLDGADATVMDAHVWVQPDDGEPLWTVGGTYQAIRLIRMMVEFWDRTRLSEQEAVFGRERDSGAPIGGTEETEVPVFTDGTLNSHIARANPRTPGSERHLMLRRGFNYSAGLDENDQLDEGLIFTCYQRSLDDGFIAVQRALDGEPLEEYIRPTGGGLFFVPPPPDPGEAFGAALFDPGRAEPAST
ncbi:MAG: Dyp-type peroxidase [Acidimicrobiales bacterium]